MGMIKPPNAGVGRKPGAKNKTTVALRDAILHAFDAVGGQSYLVDVARKDHKAFCALLGRLMPRAVTDEDACGTIIVELVQGLGDPPPRDNAREARK